MFMHMRVLHVSLLCVDFRSAPCCAAVMEENDVEEQREALKEDGEQKGSRGCCERFHLSVSKWMLPEDHREKYLERANCCPPPIFIILISLVEVRSSELVRRIYFEHFVCAA